ncbi:MAG: hypothetical protein AAF567_02395 [Actinomycetota bacterium]
MDDARNAWTDVASKFESLGGKLKHHLEQEAAVDGEPADASTQNAFDELSGRVRDAFDAFGNASRDDAVRSDVREIAEALQEAIVETFKAAGAEFEDLMERFEDFAEDAAERVAEAVGINDDDHDDDGDRGAAADLGATDDAAEDAIILESDHQDGDEGE